jgi:DNA end-binding protein Ku
MAARAMWKGELKLNSTRIPVKLYSGVIDRSVRFHILDQRKKERVKQHMVEPDSGKEVSNEEIRKGFEFEPGRFVVLDEKELKSIEPEPSRDIELVEFVPATAIGFEWYGRPYYLGPDGNQEDYFALAEALKKIEREGIAHWVMRNKAYSGALRSDGEHLMLLTLRNSDEVLSAKDLPKPTGRAPDKKELAMAKQLVELLEDEFRLSDYKDDYRERVMKFIEQKAKGHKPRLQAVKTKRATTSLDSVLTKSINALKKEKRAA